MAKKRSSEAASSVATAPEAAAGDPSRKARRAHDSEPEGQARLRELRARHPRFHYEAFSRELQEDGLRVQYQFRLESDIFFTPKLKIQGVDAARLAAIPAETLDNLLFHIGMVEVFSYWKAAAPAEIVVHAAALTDEQMAWWLDLLRRGMGEFFYVNKLDWRAPEFVNITNPASVRDRAALPGSDFSSESRSPNPDPRNLVLASGGKDTVVTLELLREAGVSFASLILNPIKAALAVVAEAGCEQPIVVRRSIDPRLLELNQQGYFNGHTPFSALLAFIATAVAALFGHDRVIVSTARSYGCGDKAQ
jgi:UDP-N-acetyl-alpha-D-muramoyl-L-alanyl-L-glutamate epimerase